MLQEMIGLGLTKDQAIKALGTQQYVQDFIDTPDWFVSAPKLPKGYKWADGARYHLKQQKNGNAETYVFLIVGDDIYIKGAFSMASFYGHNEKDELVLYKSPPSIRNKICVIKKWKGINANEVNYKLDISPFFSSSILDFYSKNGGEIGLINKIVKEVRMI